MAPFTATRKKPPPKPTWSQADVDASLAANPNAGFAPTPGTTDFSSTPGWGLGAGASTGALPPGASARLGIPGSTPDYAALIAGDPSLLSSQADLDFYGTQLGTQKTAAVRRLIIDAGLDPGNVGDVDQATRDAALANPFSSMKELERGRDRGSADLSASLAARGMTSSGGLTGGQSRILEMFERGTGGLLSQILDRIAGYEGDFADKKFGLKGQYRSLREAAALRIQADPRYQPMADTDAVLDPASGLYMTADGRWFNSARVRVDAPSPAAAPAAAPAAGPAAAPVVQLAPPPQQTIPQMAAAAKQNPDFYESDNRMADRAAAGGRSYF